MLVRSLGVLGVALVLRSRANHLLLEQQVLPEAELQLEVWSPGEVVERAIQ